MKKAFHALGAIALGAMGGLVIYTLEHQRSPDQVVLDSFEALRMLGEIYYKMDRLSEALQHLRRAREIKPENQKAIFIKGYLHARLGEITQAINEWEELREKSKNGRIVDLVKRRIEVAKEWEKVLSEY